MSANLPASPITGTHNVTVFDTIRTGDIVRLYREQEKVDVTRFFSGLDEIQILECGDTGYRFYYPYTIVGDEAFYQKLALLKNSVGLEYDRDWSDDHEFALNAIKENERVLEIGCNTGKFLERVRKKTDQLVGLEFNSEAAAVAMSKSLDVRNLDVAILAENEPESFDTICAFQVLEHIPNAGDFLRACLKALKPGGKLIFSVPNNEPYFQRFSKYEVLNLPPHHMGLWNLNSFRKLGDILNLSLIDFVKAEQSSFLSDAHLRARSMSGVMTLPDRLSKNDKFKVALCAPTAIVKSFVDKLRGIVNSAQIYVVFERR